MASSFPLSVVYAETPVLRSELTAWGIERTKHLANQLVSRAFSNRRVPLGFKDIADFELCDASLRFAEEFCPNADKVLDTYWAASRGILTVYPPLIFAQRKRDYAKMIALSAVGEAVTGYLLEDHFLHPAQLDLRPFCRPLFTAPDILMAYRRQRGRIALVEAKASENKPAEDLVLSAAASVLPVLQAWKNTGSTADAIAVGVSVGLSEEIPTIQVAIVKFVDPEGRPLHPDVANGSVAYDAAWAGDDDAATERFESLENALREGRVSAEQLVPVQRAKQAVKEEAERKRPRQASTFYASYETRGAEERTYSPRISILDLFAVAETLRGHGFAIVAERRRSIQARNDTGVEVQVFADGRIRCLGTDDMRETVKQIKTNVALVVNKTLE